MACEEIEAKYFDWRFLWAQDSITTVADTAVYSAPDGLNIFEPRSFRIDGQPLPEMIEYQNRNYTQPQAGKPNAVILRPDGAIELHPVPEQVYTITFDYYRQPMVLVNGTDVPYIPERHHKAILGRAMMSYSNFDAMSDVNARGRLIYDASMRELERSQLNNYSQTYGRSNTDDFTIVVGD